VDFQIICSLIHFVWPVCRFYKPTKIERKIYTGFWSEEEYLKELEIEGYNIKMDHTNYD
jgi:hypothetical protein